MMAKYANDAESKRGAPLRQHKRPLLKVLIKSGTSSTSFFFQKKENKRSTYVDTCKGAKSLLQQKCVVLTESTNVPDKQTEEVTKKARRGGGRGSSVPNSHGVC